MWSIKRFEGPHGHSNYEQELREGAIFQEPYGAPIEQDALFVYRPAVFTN